MPYFKTSQEWLDQSALLLEARPATTRITTKYSIKAVKPRSDTEDAAAVPPRASLVFKTYDPASGVTLKFRTTKAAEVSRLVYSSLGRLGRGMAAVPEPPELAEEAMPDAPAEGTSTPSGAGAAASSAAPQQGGGKKKKKGKK